MSTQNPHVPSLAMTELPLGSKLLAWPGFGLHPNPGKNLAAMFCKIAEMYYSVYMYLILTYNFQPSFEKLVPYFSMGCVLICFVLVMAFGAAK